MMPRKHLYFALSLACLAVACGPSSSDDAGPGETDSGTTEVDAGTDAGEATVDAGAIDAGHDAGGVEATTIAFSAPAASVEHVRGTVRLQLVTTGPDPERVELWKDGALLVVPPAPYTYDWLTDDDAEGAHVIEARAMIGGAVIATAERTFHVDRTPPTLIEVTPAADTDAALSTPIVLTFSEPLAPIADDAVTVAVDDAALARTQSLSADATGIELQLTEAPEALPATAVVTATTAITDRAGNALEADAVNSVLYPRWLLPVARADAPSPHQFVQIEIDAAGIVWILDRTEATYDLWRWDGAVLSGPDDIASGEVSVDAVLRLSSTGRPVVAYGDADDALHVDTLEADGTWSAAPVFVSDQYPFYDMELAPDDTPYLARRSALGMVEVLSLVGGTWTRVGDAFAAWPTGVLDLAVDSASVPHVGYWSVDEGGWIARYGSDWTFTSLCAIGTYTRRCERVSLGLHVDGSVRAFVVTGYRSVAEGPFAPSYSIRFPPDWDTAELGGSGDVPLVARTATGYGFMVRQGTSTYYVDDGAGAHWPLPVPSQPLDMAFHDSRPYFVTYAGVFAANTL